MELAVETNISRVPANSEIVGNRKFKKLRLSITEECNLRCGYCDQSKRNSGKETFHFEHLIEIVRNLHITLNLKSVRITGGEPTLSPDLFKIVSKCKQIGIPEVNLTTNGVFPGSVIDDLIQAGIDRINVSLDSLDREIYKKITGSDNVSKVLVIIQRAKEAGIPVKINSVIMKGLNEDQVLPLLEYGIKNEIPVRFLELMKMGIMYESHADYFYPAEKILSQIESKYNCLYAGRKVNATAAYYLIGSYSFGIIANHSESFCADCDRLRMDHKGRLFGCLSNPEYFNMPEYSILEYPEILKKAMDEKMKSEFRGSHLNMRSIGG